MNDTLSLYNQGRDFYESLAIEHGAFLNRKGLTKKWNKFINETWDRLIDEGREGAFIKGFLNSASAAHLEIGG